MKGRLLPYVYEYASTLLTKMQNAANAWTYHWFEGDHVLWQDCVAAVLYAVDLGKKAIKEYDTVPFLFSRLDQAGVKQRILDQWHEVPPQEHDRITRRLLGHDSPFLAGILAIRDDGSNISPELAHEVLCLYSFNLMA